MSNETFGFDEPPFADLHDPRAIFSSPSYRQALACLRGAIEAREPFVLLTGLPGVGKTVAVEAALAGAVPHVRATIVATTSMTREEFRERVLDGFAPSPADATPSDGGLDARLRAIAADGRAAVLVVDQAQELAAELLDDLRLYANLEADGHALLQIVLVGRPALEAVLAEPGTEALRQRIAAGHRLEPLSEPETAAYVRHRVGTAGGDGQAAFAEEACATLHRLAHGIPGEINRLATEALSLAGTAGETQVTAGHVTFAVMMLGFRSAGSDTPVPAAFAMPGLPTPAPIAESDPGPAPAPPSEPEIAAPTEWTLTLQDLSVPQDVTLPEDLTSFEPVAETGSPTGPPETSVFTEARVEPAEVVAPPVLHVTVQEPVAPVEREPVAIPGIASAPRPAEPSPVVEPLVEPVAVEARTEASVAQAPAPAPPAPRHAQRRPRATAPEKPRRARRRSGAPLLGTAALLLVAVVGLTIGHATRRRVQEPPDAAVAVTAPAEPQVPTPSPASRTSHRSTTARAASATHRLAPVHPVGSPAPPTPAPESARGNAPKGRACGVQVATFLSESRAQTERERLAATLQLPCQVIPAGDDGYAVVVGPVADVKRAEALSTELSRGGVVGQARVIRWRAPGDSGR